MLLEREAESESSWELRYAGATDTLQLRSSRDREREGAKEFVSLCCWARFIIGSRDQLPYASLQCVRRR